MPRNLLLVDGSWSIYRACASHRLLTHDGEFTGGLYGFLTSLAKAMRETKATTVVLCRDTKPYRRSLTYPAYKLKRAGDGNLSELRELYNVAEPQILEVCRVLGIAAWAVPGFESDDLIAHGALHYRSRFEEVVAHANDSDLYQLLDIPNFAIYSDRFITRAQLDVTPTQFALATALSGTHNEIEGIPGVGPARSIAAVKDPVLMRKYRATHADIIDRNRELIRLPHADLPRRLGLPLRLDCYSRQALYRYVARYGITVTSPMLEAFEQLEG